MENYPKSTNKEEKLWTIRPIILAEVTISQVQGQGQVTMTTSRTIVIGTIM
jgi:hypothetical protein